MRRIKIYNDITVRWTITTNGAAESLEAGHAVAPDWWVRIYSFLLGAPALVMFILKFTQEYDKDGKPVRNVKKVKGGNDG